MSEEEFKRTVEVWEKKVLQLPVTSNLSSKVMLKALREETGEYIVMEAEIQPWVFWVEPLERESLSHFLGRLQRANVTASLGGDEVGTDSVVWGVLCGVPLS
ncbi:MULTISPECIES: hypothetical protein [Kamptonema]|uniref:hypothetical protein n=1 Tax=Kamptonema TaxID=1501433 RepID=UPI0001DACD81|nr:MULTISPECIES: hypothetical protein [Kamptonema]CBN55689.1 hypothetical protein OSCI_2310007 [Kamptonema sp. PCC 6506]